MSHSSDTDSGSKSWEIIMNVRQVSNNKKKSCSVFFAQGMVWVIHFFPGTIQDGVAGRWASIIFHKVALNIIAQKNVVDTGNARF